MGDQVPGVEGGPSRLARRRGSRATARRGRGPTTCLTWTSGRAWIRSRNRVAAGCSASARTARASWPSATFERAPRGQPDRPAAWTSPDGLRGPDPTLAAWTSMDPVSVAEGRPDRSPSAPSASRIASVPDAGGVGATSRTARPGTAGPPGPALDSVASSGQRGLRGRHAEPGRGPGRDSRYGGATDGVTWARTSDPPAIPNLSSYQRRGHRRDAAIAWSSSAGPRPVTGRGRNFAFAASTAAPSGELAPIPTPRRRRACQSPPRSMPWWSCASRSDRT